MFINTFAYAAVDAIQGAKKQFVFNFVKYEDLSKILNNFIDAQTEYTKSAIDAGIAAGSQLTDLAKKKVK